MPSIDPDNLPQSRSRDELLDHVYQEGARRRRHRTVGFAGAATTLSVVVVLALVAVSVGEEDRARKVATGGQEGTSPVGESTAGSAGAEEVYGPPAPDPQLPIPGDCGLSCPPPANTPPGPRSATTIPANDGDTKGEENPPVPTTGAPTEECRNSTDPACGDFYWDPPLQPDDKPTLDASVLVSGLTATFHLVYQDADGSVETECHSIEFGDGQGDGSACMTLACAITGHGPHTPPPEQPDRKEVTVSHTYAGPGTYTATVSGHVEAGCPDRTPYEGGDIAPRQLRVVVPG